MSNILVLKLFLWECPIRESDLCTPRKETAQTQSSFHIHVFVSDLYIPTTSPTVFLQQNRQTDRSFLGNLFKFSVQYLCSANTGVNQFLFSVHLLCDADKLTVLGEAGISENLASASAKLSKAWQGPIVEYTQYLWSIIARQPCVVCHVYSDSCEYPSGKWFTLPPSSALESDHERERERSNHRNKNYRRAALQRRSNLCIPKNETARPHFQFPHSCTYMWVIYIFSRSVYLFCCSKIGGLIHFWEYLFPFSVQCLGSVVL